MRHGAARMQPHALRAPALINLPIALPNIPIISPIVTRLVAGINQQPTPTPTPTTPSIPVTPTPGTGNTDTGSGNSGSGSETGSGSNSGSTDNSGTDSSGEGGDSGSGSGNSSGGGDSSSSSPSDSSTGSGSGSDTSSNSGNSSGGSSNNGSSSNPPAPNPGSNPGAPSVGAPSPVSTGKGSSTSSTTSANGAGNPTTTGGSSGTASLNTNVFANSNGTDTDDTSAGTLSGSTKPDYNGGAVNVGGQFTTTLGILPDTLPSNTHDGSSPTSGSGDVTSNDDGSGGFPIGAIIAIAVVSGLGLFFLLLFFLRRRSRSKRDQRNQWWFSNFSNDSLKWSDTNNSKNATVGTASQRSSFATSYDFATRSTLRSGGSIDIPVSPPMVEVRDTHTPGLMMHGSQTPSPLIISIEHTESRRASVHSDMSVSSDPYSQCIIIRDDKLLSGITTPMSVRPFSPSESFAFPKPPTSQNAGWAEDLKRASAGTTLKSTFESYTADPFADSPTLPVTPSSLEPVYRPFSPTLHDELGVEAGDLVNVVKVFDDGWILVEKVTAASAGGKGKFTAPGLIPIDCLRDERENLPEFLAAKRASGYSVGRASVCEWTGTLIFMGAN